MKDRLLGSHVRVAYTDRPEVYFSGTIRNLSHDSLRVHLDRPLIEDALVTVEFSPGCVEVGTVAHCHQEDNGSCVAINFRSILAKVARSEDRTKLVETVTVFNLDVGTSDRPFHATTTDISPSGLGMRTPQPLPVGSLVRVERKHSTLIGEVRHCQPFDEKYFRVGVQIERQIVRNQQKGGGLLRRVMRRLHRALIL